MGKFVAEVLTEGASLFLTELAREFNIKRLQLLQDRKIRQSKYDIGELPDFLPETEHIRNTDWQVAEIPPDILDRRVEITGPPERKMVINALNSGASVFMADLEDSLSPTWENVIHGQVNLRDAVRGNITYLHPTKGLYKLNDDPAVLFVRPRGLHLDEYHFAIDGAPTSASLFDFGLFMYHNARYLVDKGSAPYFYLPKLEHYTEARWWNEVFVWAQKKLGIPVGTIRATVLLETLPAAFQMNEILYELKDHSAGLNCGRWDYIFSYIKTFRYDPSRVLPNRAEVTMKAPFMSAYSRQVIQVCHRRGAHAMGGMAAQIPIRGDETANAIAMDKVLEDKRREALDGHDGTWVAHPGLVSLAKGVFDELMPGPNQITRETGYECSRDDLIQPIYGSITMAGLKKNVEIGTQYLHAWLGGNGCVPINNLMEDAATAEISRAQVWSWIKHAAVTDDGSAVNPAMLKEIIRDIVDRDPEYIEAARMFMIMCLQSPLADFLTLQAYRRISRIEPENYLGNNIEKENIIED